MSRIMTGDPPDGRTPTEPGGGMPPGTRTFVPPSFYRTPFFPYAGLNDQLQDALGLAGRGAGGFTNMASPLMQYIRNGQARVGGGLLGGSVYGGGNPFARSTPGMPGGLLGGGMRPNPPVQAGTPGRWGNPLQPDPRMANPPFQRPGGPGARVPTGGAGDPPEPAPSLPGANPPAPRSVSPGGPTSDPKALADLFMSTPEAHRGNLFNALSQYGLGKGGTGAGGLGGQLQAELRNRMGTDQFSNWLTGMDNKQGSTVGREGLPSWLISALGG